MPTLKQLIADDEQRLRKLRADMYETLWCFPKYSPDAHRYAKLLHTMDEALGEGWRINFRRRYPGPRKVRRAA